MKKSYKYKRLLVRRYQILAVILILLSGGLVLLPKYEKNEGIQPENFVLNMLSHERYISTDQLADRIINQDPTLLIIDVRSEQDFSQFHIPNAVNIPLKNIFDTENTPYLDQNTYDVVLYSNDNYYSDQVYLLCKRLDFNNLYVLKGGLNKWFSTILNPSVPSETSSQKTFELYQKRIASRMYFGIGTTSKNKVVKKAPKKVIKLVKKKKKVAEGGC